MLIRRADASDAQCIFDLIVQLAVYEKEPNAVVCTAEDLAAQLGQDAPPFECVIAEIDRNAVGFALYFHNYSTWRGRPGLYLEDLFVVPAARGTGVGKRLLSTLADIAVRRDCARMEWSVLDWNGPAIDFYRNLGAEPMTGWTTFRLTGKNLERLAAESASESRGAGSADAADA